MANGDSFLAAIIANLGANPFLGYITEGANASESRQQTPEQSGKQPAYRSSLASLCPLPFVSPSLPPPSHLSSVREHIYTCIHQETKGASLRLMLPQSGLGEIIIISVYVASLELVNLKRKLPSVGSASLVPPPPPPPPHSLPSS